MKIWISMGMAASCYFASTNGFAQQADPAVEKEAQALLESAVELMEAKQYAPACRKLEMVLQKLPQATGARLELAYCYRGEGKFASAWQQFVQIEELARNAGQSARVAEARKNANELAKIVNKLQLDVPADVAAIPGVTVMLDGQNQQPSSWGVPVPVDAMEHLITATAPGHEPWTTRILVTNNSRPNGEVAPIVVKVGSPSLPGTNLQLDVPLELTRIPGVNIKLDDAPVYLSEWADGGFISAGAHTLQVTASGYEPWTKQLVIRQGERVVVAVPLLKKRVSSSSDVIANEVIAPEKSSGSNQRVAGIIGLGVGGAAIGVGALLGGMAISRNQASDDGHCDADDFCDPTGYALRSEALKLANSSTAVFVAGGVLMATGIVLVATSAKPTSPMTGRTSTTNVDRSNTTVWFGPTSLGVRYAW